MSDEINEFLTLPLSRYTDADGYFDGVEVLAGSDPLDPDSLPDSLDWGGDGLINDREAKIYGTHPQLKDTDFDGLTDAEEVMTTKTNPIVGDTDGDGFWDGEELERGFDPLDANSRPSIK